MDVVLRTPHGEGEISLVADSTSVTLGDVVERVVGHPAPPVLYVDGRAMSSQTLLSEAGVVMGSLIDTDDATFDTTHAAPVEIWQLAGHGCGMTAPLLPGDYRIGPGRRIHADELAMAPVDESVMELRVDGGGGVMVRDRSGVELVGGPPTNPDRFVEWTHEPLAVEGRIFTLRRPVDRSASAADADQPVARRPTADGTITFHRLSGGDQPARPGEPYNPTDALTLARARSTQLWRRRGTGPGEFRVPLGLHIAEGGGRHPGDPGGRHGESSTNGTGDQRRLQPIEAVLDTGRGLAFVGGSDFARSSASGLLVLAATLYGPADLEIIVVTTTERADSWEWAKWLPHNRIDGHPKVIVSERQLRRWLHRHRSQWTSSQPARRRTLMVIDDENAWHERTSPLREIVADENAPISFVVLTAHLHDVPTLCDTIVSERSHGTAHVELRHRRRRFDDVHAFVVSTDLATEVARRLAPLDDALMVVEPQTGSTDPMSVDDLHDLATDPRATIAHRWDVARHDAADPGLDLRLGFAATSSGAPSDIVSIDIAQDGPHLLVIAADPGPDSDEVDGHGVIDAALIGACVDVPPDELEIVLLSGGDTSPILAALPHVSASFGHLGDRGVLRSVRSLQAERRRRRAVLERIGVADISTLSARGDRTTLRRLVVVVDRLDAITAGAFEGLRPILEFGSDVGIHVIASAHDLDAVRGFTALFGATVTIHSSPTGLGADPSPDAPGTASRHATLRLGGRRPIDFEPPTLGGRHDDAAAVDVVAATGGLSIQPFVVARDLTPMERRLVGAGVGVSSPSPRRITIGADVLALIDAIADEARRRPFAASPPIADELPAHVDLLRFLREHPGDGVPFALADAPGQQGHEPVWWLPGRDASMVVYGVARSRVSALVPALAIGAAMRLGTADVRFHILGADTGPLEPLAQLPHTASLTPARARSLVESLVDDLEVEVDRRLGLVRPDVSTDRVAASETAVVVLIDDVGGCRRLLEGGDRDVWDEIEHLLVRGRPVGVCGVLIARRTDEISTRLAASIDTHLVAQLAVNDRDHRFVGTDDPAGSSVPGRARRDGDGVELQFATLPADLTSVINEHLAARHDRELP